MFDFFFRYFLLFPKLIISSHWGILIGEMILVFYWVYFLSTKKRISVNGLVVTYYMFVIHFVFISSLIMAINFGILPLHSTLYLVRLILCFGLFVWAFTYYREHTNNHDLVARVYNRPFFIHFVISIVIMAFYYAIYKPEANLILWGYEVGLRMVPLAGLVIDSDGFFFLKAISGSGNLLSGWALAILIINFNLGRGQYSKLIVVVAILTVLLTISRGGFLTLALYLLYVFYRSFDGKFSLRAIIATTVVVVSLIFYFSFSETTPLPNIFTRLTNTIDGSSFDGSTQGRLDNYIALITTWVQKWYYIVFGFGFDEETLMIASKQSVVESFFLEILVCSGLIGALLFAFFFANVFIRRLQNFWYRALWEFLLFQSIISWTVTGGDFLAPHATYIILTFIGFGFAQNLREIERNTSSPIPLS